MNGRIFLYACETTEKLTTAEKLILVALAYYYIDYKECSCATIEQLSHFCRMSLNTVRRNLVSMEKKRIILRLDRRNSRDRTRYKMLGYMQRLDDKAQKPLLELFIEYFWKLYPNKTHKTDFLKEVYRMQPDQDEQNAMTNGLYEWIDFWQENDIKPMGAARFVMRRIWEREPQHEEFQRLQD